MTSFPQRIFSSPVYYTKKIKKNLKFQRKQTKISTNHLKILQMTIILSPTSTKSSYQKNKINIKIKTIKHQKNKNTLYLIKYSKPNQIFCPIMLYFPKIIQYNLKNLMNIFTFYLMIYNTKIYLTNILKYNTLILLYHLKIARLCSHSYNH